MAWRSTGSGRAREPRAVLGWRRAQRHGPYRCVRLRRRWPDGPVRAGAPLAGRGLRVHRRHRAPPVRQQARLDGARLRVRASDGTRRPGRQGHRGGVQHRLGGQPPRPRHGIARPRLGGGGARRGGRRGGASERAGRRPRHRADDRCRQLPDPPRRPGARGLGPRVPPVRADRRRGRRRRCHRGAGGAPLPRRCAPRPAHAHPRLHPLSGADRHAAIGPRARGRAGRFRRRHGRRRERRAHRTRPRPRRERTPGTRRPTSSPATWRATATWPPSSAGPRHHHALPLPLPRRVPWPRPRRRRWRR
jgi:hypothetical protein